MTKGTSAVAVSKRQSSRLTKSVAGIESSSNSSPARTQTRITSFVSARKRAVEPVLKKELISTVSLPSTPVKIKKRSTFTKPEAEKENLCENTETLTAELEDAEPAYKRFAHLVKDVPAPESFTVEAESAEIIDSALASSFSKNQNPSQFIPWLPLRERFGIYEKIVFNIDSLCMLSAGRSLPCVFHKIQKNLENSIQKSVQIDHLERIKTVWSDAFEYTPMKIIMQGKRVDSFSITVPGLAETDSTAALLNDRKEGIKARVQNFVIKAHNEFVSQKFNRPVPADAVLKQWHPEFDQDLIADIPRTGLLSDQLIEAAARKTTEVPKSIASILSTPTKSSVSSAPATPVASESEPVKLAENHVKMTLLERIRAKEQKMISDRMFGNDLEKARELALLAQLEKFCQSVMISFASDKKTSMFLTDLSNRLILSSPIPISASEVLERLKLLQKVVPNWIRVKDEPPAPRTVKLLDKNFTLTQIIGSLNSYYHQKTLLTNSS
jgi:hypothetical protein